MFAGYLHFHSTFLGGGGVKRENEHHEIPCEIVTNNLRGIKISLLLYASDPFIYSVHVYQIRY